MTLRSRVAFLLTVLVLGALAGCTPAELGLEAELAGGSLALQVVDGPAGQTQAFVPVRIEGRGPFRFALDTGASQSLVDRQVARQADLPVVARGRPVSGVGGVARADVARIERWRAGTVELPSSRAAVLRLQEPPGAEARSSRGLLGSDVLSRFGLVTIDYDSRRLVLGRAGAPDRDDWRTLSLRVVRGPERATLAFVDVTVGGEEVPFAVDTGASLSVIDSDLAERLGLEVVARGQPVTGVTGAGRADIARMQGWRADGVRLPATRVALLDLPEPPPGTVGSTLRGLLGSDVLSRFGAVAIDYREETLTLRPRG